MNPSYKDLGDHTETVSLSYDPNVVSFETLLSVFWANHNPTIPSQRQYRSLILHHNEEQKLSAQKSLMVARQKTSDEIHTEILPAGKYYEAETYHQKYVLQQHPWLITALLIQTREDLIKSHACTKLNGYLAGYGSLEDALNEAKRLGLNEKMMDYVKIQIENHHSYTHR